MIQKGYLPTTRDKYVSLCHLKALIEKETDVFLCSECRKELTHDSILHLYDEIPQKYNKYD